MPQVRCKICETRFYAKPVRLQIGGGKYCSKICNYKGQENGAWVNCFVCDKPTYRTLKNLKASQSKKYFCTKSCLAVWKNKTLLSGERNAPWKHGRSAYRGLLIKNDSKPVCQECGINDIKVLIVHHQDKNRKNNSLDNLRWLCRNCHYLAR